jgi:REP element-mobilizing transposase RayT
MPYYARHLPHWQPHGRSIFLTWRLHGSLPEEAVRRLKQGAGLSPGEYFLDVDRILDRAKTGECWLANSQIADCVAAAIRRGENLGHYVLQAFAIMPNHVHLLIEPSIPIHQVTRSLKGVTAREAKVILSRTGNHFWQDESFDHYVRDGKQFNRIEMYIENNPVAAGLVQQPQLWRWSSAAQP